MLLEVALVTRLWFKRSVCPDLEWLGSAVIILLNLYLVLLKDWLCCLYFCFLMLGFYIRGPEWGWVLMKVHFKLKRSIISLFVLGSALLPVLTLLLNFCDLLSNDRWGFSFRVDLLKHLPKFLSCIFSTHSVLLPSSIQLEHVLWAMRIHIVSFPCTDQASKRYLKISVVVREEVRVGG
jgi:hypothetical protein